MRIAIVFSGRIDKYREHYHNIMTNVVQNHEADFFLSHSPEFAHEDLADFCQLYRPKTVNNGPIDYGDFSKYTCHPQSNSHNMMCMWFNRRRVYQDMCNYMKETGTTYDLVINTRLDTYNDDPLNYHLFECLDDNTVLVPEGYDWGGLNDQMAIGRFPAMAKYLTLFDRIYEILDQLPPPYYGPEPALKKNMEMQGVEVYRFPFRYRLINGKLWHHA